ncbi:MAG: peptidoglycan DD-metalloendopeptidase family protein [Bacteroidales bacterium]|nr:peptidoglycan DD-metalloendopeptidase family protein [Bacteroidales bacterium]
MKRFINQSIYFLSLFAFIVSAVGAGAQNVNPRAKKTEVKVNEMDVIYDEEDYEDLMIDERTQEEYSKQTIPNLLAPPPLKYDDEYDPVKPLSLQESEDEGAEHEDDILIAGFDSSMIHYPKKEFVPGEEVKIMLVDDKHKFVFPTPYEARATSHFGPRRRRFHYGVDLAQPTGKDIYAAFDGVVRVSKYNKSYGNLIVIHHDNGLETYYAHLSQRYAKVGMHVKAGDVIGLCGNTGRSYGSHLHFEIRYMGNAMNPEHVIDCTNHKLISNELTLTQNSFRKVGDSRRGGSGGAVASSSGGHYYKVRSGDTLSKIAARHRTTVRRLCQLNGIKETTTLSIGRRLRVR